MKIAKICRTTWPYFQKVLSYHSLKSINTHHDPDIWGGDQVKIQGFPEYNFLSDINSCFSDRPGGLIRDRTDSIKFPFMVESSEKWKVPTKPVDLETCFFMRVKDIESKFDTVNLLWSGGIDSTAMIVAWLKNADPTTKIRILYSLDSIKENTSFFLHLHDIVDTKHIDLIEIGGTFFYRNQLNGAEVSGGSGDDLTASVDESFFNIHGWWTLQSSWKTFFWKKNPNQDFIDFCEKWFAFSGMEINTVLQARWWFYFNKCAPPGPCRIVKNNTNGISSFFNHKLFGDFFSQNIDRLFRSSSWNTYKQDLKDYIYSYHADDEYRRYKCKENSGGYFIFANKSQLVNKQENIMELSDGTVIRTNHLPFLSEYEYRQQYQTQLDYLFYQ